MFLFKGKSLALMSQCILWCYDTVFCNVYIGNAYNADERTVAAGYDNGDIKLFDLKNMSLRWETNVKNGVSICQLSQLFQDI